MDKIDVVVDLLLISGHNTAIVVQPSIEPFNLSVAIETSELVAIL